MYSTIKIRTSNVRSPLELGSDRHETSGKRVSDDLQLSIFWRQKNFFKIFFRIFSTIFSHFRQILEERGIFGRQNRIPRGIFALDSQIFTSVQRLAPILWPLTAPRRRGSGKSRNFCSAAHTCRETPIEEEGREDKDRSSTRPEARGLGRLEISRNLFQT